MDKHRTLALVVLAGTGTFLYQIAGLLSKIESWEVIWNPPNVAQMLFAMVAALVAIGAALGLNVKTLFAGFVKES
jgi:hypothetical protein